MNGRILNFARDQEHRHIDVKDIPGEPQIFRIFIPKESDEPLGMAIITHSCGDCMLHYINVREDYRRRGLGSNLIEALKSKFDSIVTGHSTKEGVELCLACGFEYEAAGIGGKMKFLVWRKDKGGRREAEKGETLT